MSQRYAFVVKFLPERAESKLLAGRCIKVLHEHVFQHKGFAIGVGFPGWNDESLGGYISFVSISPERLLALKTEHYFCLMESEEFFGVSEVIEVPNDCDEVRFVRNQGIKKCFVGEKRRRLRRAKRRSELRNEIFSPQISVIERQYDKFHVAQIDSNTTQQRFSLFIQKEKGITESQSSYNAYGLSTNSRYRGTVPELGELIDTLF